jgi:hypothetical protein
MFNQYSNSSKRFHSILQKSLLIGCIGVSNLSAGMFDGISNVIESVSSTSEQKLENTLSVHSSSQELGKRQVPKSNSQSSQSTASIKLGTPDASLIELTECTDLELSNIILGYDGNYTFKNGFKKEKRSGFIKREKGKASHGCILPSLNSGQTAYLEVDSKKFKALGNSNSWTMQCVRSNNLDAGVLTNEYPREGFLSGKAMMLHCGNSEGIKECAKGSNSSRSGAWKKKLEKDGKKMFSFKAIKATLAPKGGEKVYCQYYNSDSGKSLFAFEYLRTK